MRWRRRIDADIDQAIANVTWNKPPLPSVPAPPPAPGRGAQPPAAPAPGHNRGHHMVIDTWECGCIYTWTRTAGWRHDFDCLDEEIRRLLTP